MEKEKKGFIYKWNLLGNGFVVTGKKEIFFLHHTAIEQGADLAAIGQPVHFNVAPARPGKRFPCAVNAVVGWPEANNDPADAAAPAATSTDGRARQ